MVTVNLICIGKLKEDYLRAASAEYQKRLSAFCRLNIIELPEHRLPQSPSDAEIARGIEVEGEAITAKLEGVAIPLCIEGQQLSSEALADRLQRYMVGGESELSFIIGGSYGLADTVKAAGALKLSMSPMTFPHQLARVMLLEQIYRAFSINQNTRYHK